MTTVVITSACKDSSASQDILDPRIGPFFSLRCHPPPPGCHHLTPAVPVLSPGDILRPVLGSGPQWLLRFGVTFLGVCKSKSLSSGWKQLGPAGPLGSQSPDRDLFRCHFRSSIPANTLGRPDAPRRCGTQTYGAVPRPTAWPQFREGDVAST